MIQTAQIPMTYVVPAGAARAQTPAPTDRNEPDVSIIVARNRLCGGDVDEQGSNCAPLDANTRLLAQLLATQTEILATLKSIEAKMPASTW